MNVSSSPDEVGGAAEAADGRPNVPWSWLDGVIVLICAFVIYIIGDIILALIDLPIEGTHPGFWFIPVSYLWLTFGTFFMVFTWLVLRRGTSWSTVGFHLPGSGTVWRRIGRTIGLVIGAYIVILVGTAVITGLLDLTSFHVKGNVKELLPQGQSTVSVAQFVTLLILAAVIAPITEETLFRGALYQGVRRDLSRLPAGLGRWLGPALAAILVGTVFGLFHLIGGTGEIFTLPILAFLGLILCLVFEFSGGLPGSMLLHGTVNCISVAVYYGAHLH